MVAEQPINILIVDDESHILHSAALVLVPQGFRLASSHTQDVMTYGMDPRELTVLNYGNVNVLMTGNVDIARDVIATKDIAAFFADSNLKTFGRDGVHLATEALKKGCPQIICISSSPEMPGWILSELKEGNEDVVQYSGRITNSEVGRFHTTKILDPNRIFLPIIGQHLKDGYIPAENGHDILLIVAGDERRNYLARSLEKVGYKTRAAADFPSACTALSTTPDVIIASLDLKGQADDGIIEFLQYIQNNDSLQRIPFLMVGGGEKRVERRAGRMRVKNSQLLNQVVDFTKIGAAILLLKVDELTAKRPSVAIAASDRPLPTSAPR